MSPYLCISNCFQGKFTTFKCRVFRRTLRGESDVWMFDLHLITCIPRETWGVVMSSKCIHWFSHAGAMPLVLIYQNKPHLRTHSQSSWWGNIGYIWINLLQNQNYFFSVNPACVCQVLVWENLWLPMCTLSHYYFGGFGKFSEKRLSAQSTYDIFIEIALRIYFPWDFYWSWQLLCDLFVRSGVSWCYWSSRFLCEELHWLVSWQALKATCKAVTGDICHHKSGASS